MRGARDRSDRLMRRPVLNRDGPQTDQKRIRRPRSLLEKLLLADLCLFSIAALLLLLHRIVVQHSVLLWTSSVLLAAVVGLAAVEHNLIFKRARSGTTLPLSPWGHLLYLALAGFYIVGPLIISCLTAAGIAATVA